jgi:hypothetical protein
MLEQGTEIKDALRRALIKIPAAFRGVEKISLVAIKSEEGSRAYNYLP